MTQETAPLEAWAEIIFQALRAYRRPAGSLPEELHTLNLVAQELRTPAAPTGAVAHSWAMRRVLEEGVSELERREPEMAELIRTRFFQGKSVIATAHTLGLSESSVYYRQKQAIQVLAELLHVREQSLQPSSKLTSFDQTVPGQTSQAAMLSPVRIQPSPIQPASIHKHPISLPPPTYGRLFGIDKKVTMLQNALRPAASPWTILILGLGGMGKSTLAHTVSTWAAQEAGFSHTVWMTAKQEEYNTWQGQRQNTQNAFFASIEHNAPLTYEKLLDTLATQMGLYEVLRGSGVDGSSSQLSNNQPTNHRRKQEQLRNILSEQPALIVIDNLESVAQDNTLVQGVCELARPSKILFTSRHAVDLPDSLLVRMDELTWEDSLALLRYEAEQRGFQELLTASPATLEPLYTLVGGNPLALKLVVGQLASLPLAEVVHRLKQAHKVSDRAEYELYHYLYWQSWQLLSEAARELLLTMPALPQRGATWEQLLQASGLNRSQLSIAINELITHSLLNAGGWPDKIYSIHQLTHTFLMAEVLKWW